MPKSKRSVHRNGRYRKVENGNTVWLWALIGLALAFIALAFSPRQIALPGFVALLVIAVIVATVSGIRMAISPFEESASCGLMYTYVPRYWLYYLVTRRRRMLRPFLWHVGGDALAVASFVALTARMTAGPAVPIDHSSTGTARAVAERSTESSIVANGDERAR